MAYSVRNQSNHWIEVLPPQIEVSSPGDKSEGEEETTGSTSSRRNKSR